MRDVTDERRNARAAHENEVRLGAIVSSAMDAIISTDDSLTIVLANPAAEALFGYRPGALLGQRLDLLIPEGDRNRHRAAMRHFAATADRHRRMSNAPVRGPHADGSEIPTRGLDGQERGRWAHALHRDAARPATPARRRGRRARERRALPRAGRTDRPGVRFGERRAEPSALSKPGVRARVRSPARASLRQHRRVGRADPPRRPRCGAGAVRAERAPRARVPHRTSGRRRSAYPRASGR